MTHASLFSGVGGFDLGFDLAGHETVFQCEIDKACREVLEHHWPGVRRHDDIRTLDGRELRGVGIISGGDPCQRNSAASGTFQTGAPCLGREFVRVVADALPKWVVRENPRTVRPDAPWPAERFAACLEAMGYDCLILDLQCAAFTGVSRDRTFVMGSDTRRIARLAEVVPVGSRPSWNRLADGAPREVLASLTCHPDRYCAEDNFILEPDGRVRLLDGVERIRAQGFPDTWIPEAEGRRYIARLTGNAVPVPAARWLGKRIANVENWRRPCTCS